MFSVVCLVFDAGSLMIGVFVWCLVLSECCLLCGVHRRPLKSVLSTHFEMDYPH